MKRNLTTWKETSIEFIKYEASRLWANIYEIHWDFHSAIISLQEKNVMKAISVTITESSDVRCLWPVSNKYIYEIFKVREMHRHYIQADTYCLSVTAEDLNLYLR